MVLAYSTPHMTKNIDDHPLLSITDCLLSPICYNKTNIVYNRIQSTIKQYYCLSQNISATPSQLVGIEKGKGTLNRPESPEGDRGTALLFLDLGARRGWVVSTTPRPLYPRERPGIHCTGGWVGPRAGLDVCEKSRPPTGFDPRTVQPVASRYTD
jgi:hypothetical protein